MQRFSLWWSLTFFSSLFIMLDSAASRQKRLTIKEFASRLKKKYGEERKLAGPISFDGMDVYVVDKMKKEKDGRYSFYRDVSAGELQFATVKLKVPRELDADHLDSSQWEIDHTSLDFKSYTVTVIEEMFASGAVDMDNKRANVLLFGLNSGYLSSYLRRIYPEMSITVHETEQQTIDFARRWFGFEEDGRHIVLTGDDPAIFAKVRLDMGERFNVILIDTCTPEETVSPLCPVPIFYNSQMVERLARLLTPRGAIIVQITALDAELSERLGAAKKVKSAFEHVMRNCLLQYAPYDRPLMVLTCTNHERPRGAKQRYLAAMHYDPKTVIIP